MITKSLDLNAWQTCSKWSVNVSSYCYIRCLEIVWEKVTGLTENGAITIITKKVSFTNTVSLQELHLRKLLTETRQRRQWQPTPALLPGQSHARRGLVGYSLWGCKESDTTKQLTRTHNRDPSAHLHSETTNGLIQYAKDTFPINCMTYIQHCV